MSPFASGKGDAECWGDSRSPRDDFRARKNADDPNEVVKVAVQPDESKYRHEKKYFMKEFAEGRGPVVVPANDPAQRSSGRPAARLEDARSNVE